MDMLRGKLKTFQPKTEKPAAFRPHKKPERVLLYSGPSLLDGQPIVVLATGFKRSKNTKTGNLLHIWILARDLPPTENLKINGAKSICGQCPLGARLQKDGTFKVGACYVNLIHGPQNVWHAYHRGAFEKLNKRNHKQFFQGHAARFGAYGDPAAVPLSLWEWLASTLKKWTGYTHQWEHCPPEYSRFLMASCENERQRRKAHVLGYRTFRTRLPNSPVLPGEIICPASEEAGKRLTCETCLACYGNPRGAVGRADVTIVAHGVRFKQQLYQLDFGGEA